MPQLRCLFAPSRPGQGSSGYQINEDPGGTWGNIPGRWRRRGETEGDESEPGDLGDAVGLHVMNRSGRGREALRASQSALPGEEWQVWTRHVVRMVSLRVASAAGRCHGSRRGFLDTVEVQQTPAFHEFFVMAGCVDMRGSGC